MPSKPLVKALADAGIGSRRRMADAIKQGKVEVNGAVAESFNHPVDTGRDKVFLNGQRVNLKAEGIICVMLNKPAGVVTTVSDDKGRPTVLDILPEKYRGRRLYPVGRLDMDTTGLILLTNDGDLTYRLTHPKFQQEKEYLVQTEGRLLPGEIRCLQQGITLEDGPTYPAVVKKITTLPNNYGIIIHEGRKRQVRRMFEHLGHRVASLKRVRIGGLRLGDLAEGAARPLTSREMQALAAPAEKASDFSKRGRV